MNRPTTITDEDIARWDAQLAADTAGEFKSNIALADLMRSMYGFPPTDYSEVWYTGEWLGEQLAALGASQEEVQEVCFANGQKLAFSKDLWKTTQDSLAQYKTGSWDKPGPELAKRIMATLHN